MPSFCMVFNCSSNAARDAGIRFFRIPSIYSTGRKVNELAVLRRSEWIQALKRKDLTETKLKYGRVCSHHFYSGHPADLKDREDPDWVPSLYMGCPTSSRLKNDVKNTEKRRRGETPCGDEIQQMTKSRKPEVKKITPIQDTRRVWDHSNGNYSPLYPPKAVPSKCFSDNEEEDVVEEIILQYTDLEQERQGTEFEMVNVKEEAHIEEEDSEYAEEEGEEYLEEEEDDLDQVMEDFRGNPGIEVETLWKKVQALRRKTNEQEQTIGKLKFHNESLARDLHNERHQNLCLKNKMNLLNKKRLLESSREHYLGNCIGESKDQIVLIVTNDEER